MLGAVSGVCQRANAATMPLRQKQEEFVLGADLEAEKNGKQNSMQITRSAQILTESHGLCGSYTRACHG